MLTLKLPSMLPVDQEEVKVSKTSSTVVAVEARANLQVGFSRSFLATLPGLRNVNVNQNPHRHFWALFMGFQITGRGQGEQFYCGGQHTCRGFIF